ncbi:ethanolamine utilization protein EutJ [Photobacterium lipolyticum]|uniref:Ethanolamine utilization protein EutJ n=1 Tax=Photobacterium lipolyticum TaxID=266810 RepID=A0A2T3N1B1_9GAMM|nr:ethanolamine utilization protein EutJ [Photobacterium lipolyticum]PSW06117.1 ethanolamine utilization protein EutJ [Photobacterium lipolyticum]
MKTDYLAQTNQNLLIIDEIVNDETPITAPEHVQIGIDLGTADIQTVVIDDQGTPIAAFLDWADVVRDGVVVDYFGACQIVRSQLQKVQQKLGIEPKEAITSYPPGTDPRISINVVESTGIVVSHVIDEPSSVAALLHIDSGAVVDVGGGTTGTAIIENGNLVLSLDEPSGGRHVSLTIAGGMGIDMEKAEQFKRRSHEEPMVAAMAKPVIEKMSDIVAGHIAGHQPGAIYLTGGGTLIKGFAEIFNQTFPAIEIVELSRALYLTPLAIASYGLTLQGEE